MNLQVLLKGLLRPVGSRLLQNTDCILISLLRVSFSSSGFRCTFVTLCRRCWNVLVHWVARKSCVFRVSGLM